MAADNDNNYDITGANSLDITIASEYINGKHYQLNKITHGPTGTSRMTSADYPLPVGLCGAWSAYHHTIVDGSNAGQSTLKTYIFGQTGDPVVIQGKTGSVAVPTKIMSNFSSEISAYADAKVSIHIPNSGLTIRRLSGGTAGEAYDADLHDSVRIQGMADGLAISITPAGPEGFPVTFHPDNEGVTATSVRIQGALPRVVEGETLEATPIAVTADNLRIRGITSTTDSIRVMGGLANGTIGTAIYGFTGGTLESVYSTDNAIWANIKNGLSLGAVVTANNLDIRDLIHTTDSVQVRGQGPDNNYSHSTVPTNISIRAKNDAFIVLGGVTGAGWSGAAMNVNFVGTEGLTFLLTASATFGAQIGITQSQSTPVPVHGSTFATSAIWVAGGTSGEAVVIVGNCGGFLPVILESSTLLTAATFNTQTSTTNSKLEGIKTGTDHAFGIKSALYAREDTNAAGDSLFTLVKNSRTAPVDVLKSTVITTQGPPSISVSVSRTRQQSMFTASTGFAGYTAKSLDEFITGATGLTCENGVTIKASRVGPSANEFISIISDADINEAGNNNTARNASSFPLYHGEEILVKVDNINKISIFYSSLDTSFAPNNTGSGMTFSFIV